MYKFLKDIWLPGVWPLLAFTLECQNAGDKGKVKELRQNLSKSLEILVEQQVLTAIKTMIQGISSEKEQAKAAMSLHVGIVSTMPELVSIAARLRIEVHELLQMYLLIPNAISEHKLPAFLIQDIFLILEKVLSEPQKIKAIVMRMAYNKWSMDDETFFKGKQLLIFILEGSSQIRVDLQMVMILFLKLLTFDRDILSLAPSLLSALTTFGEEQESKFFHLWMLAGTIDDYNGPRFLDRRIR